MKSRLIARVSFVLALVLGPLGGSAAAQNTSSPDTSRFPQRFILNGLLVPALDADAVPLRWVDPRSAIQCGPGTSVRVDGVALSPGDLVPNAPFELEWHADGCRPFGAAGPRFDGDVTLTVFREEWGFSAIVTPRGLRIMTASRPLTIAQPGAATMPQSVPDEILLANGLLSDHD